MGQQNPQTRLLINLLKATKEYTSSLATHLVASHTALSGLQAYASASNPSTAPAILGLADALKAADDALARYSNEVDRWKDRLNEVKDAEEEVANILRDREILVTRLIKASNKKPTRDSVIHSPSPTGSQVSLGTMGSNNKSAQQERLNSAQVELRACEAQLSHKQRELEQLRSLVIRDGLEARCMALIQLGSALSESGGQGIRALRDDYPEAAADGYHQNITVTSELYHDFPRPSSPTAASDTSLAPSQSASQSGSGLRNQPTFSLVPLAAAHRRSTRMEHVAEEGESSGSEVGDLQVVENPPRTSEGPPIEQSSQPVPLGRLSTQSAFTTSPSSTNRPYNFLMTHVRLGSMPHRDHSSDVGVLPNAARRRDSGSASSRDVVASDGGRRRRGFFGAVAGLFKSRKNGHGHEAGRGHQQNHTGSSNWKTRTDKNVADMRANGVVGSNNLDDHSSDEEHQNLVVVSNGLPSTRLTVPANMLPSKGGKGNANDGLGLYLTASTSTKSKGPTRSKSTPAAPSWSKSLPSKKKRGMSFDLAVGASEPNGSRISSPGKIRKRNPSLSGKPTPSESSILPGKTAVIGLSPSSDAAIAAETPSRNASIKPSRTREPTKMLHLTPPTEVSTAWLSNTPLKQQSAHRNIPPHHKRTASTRDALAVTKPVNLMMLVDNVATERARDVAIGQLQRSSTPKMILPSEYMKAGGVPLFEVNPPTPNHSSSSHPQTREPPKQSSTLSSPNGPSLEVRHEPPPRSTSPLRSALRHRPISPSHSQPTSTPPSPSVPSFITTSPPQISVHPPAQPPAPVPLRPRSWARDFEDDASAYETAYSEDEAPDNVPTSEKGDPLAVAVANLEAKVAVDNGNGVIPSKMTNSPPSTEISAADGLLRRKSVRLDVPVAPQGEHHLYYPDHSLSPDMNRELPKLPSLNSPIPEDKPKKHLNQQSANAHPTSFSSRSNQSWHSRIKDEGYDVWADSSEEDESYAAARSLLDKARRREKAAKAEAARLLGGTSKQAAK
ncbi:uncharacterized protein EI90DRAFT_3125065 [Cantharellus anzutake]|uniref:uncharacterized protein n=1 Tax=Cantharellus anzutake TaxID=1750568 RepID=UPI001905BBB5|nr:uncharacterized protein EI90DRAFT_3125065 [Cantharellus anzutake]KAF8329801.1 hypothetical protein EI90DRAFT_3125065 [Cantharellus anzutake]